MFSKINKTQIFFILKLIALEKHCVALSVKKKSVMEHRDFSSSIVHSDRTGGHNSRIEKLMIILSVILFIITLPFSLVFSLAVVDEFQRVVIMRNGKVLKGKPVGPGLIFYLPCIDTLTYIDLRTCCYPVPPQEALTKDSLTVTVDAVVYYKIKDPVYAVINVTDYKSSTQFLAATSLRNALGMKNLVELLQNRPAVGYQVYEQLKESTKDWGVEVERVEIKDISLPLQLQKAMAAEAESTRLASAKIIVAEAEIEATKNLQEATKLLMHNPMCMQLRYLQSLHTISSENTHTVVFPFPTDVMKKFFK